MRLTIHRVSWFSAGVSSAVATRLAIEEIDEIIYTHIDDQHPDTLRFVRECGEWFGRPVTILQSEKANVATAIKTAGGKGYWNKIRVDFPQVFEARAKLEREVGASCINGVFLDELDPNAGRHEGPIVDECGLLCEVQSLGTANKP